MFVSYYRKPNGQWDEVTEFRNSLTKSILTNARVVLDFRYRRCVKNTVNPELGYDELLEYYKKELGDQLTPHLPQSSP
jgi:hypothetical protein